MISQYVKGPQNHTNNLVVFFI